MAFDRLRDHILQQGKVSVKTLQRLQRKCISFTLAVPGARLYILEMCQAIAKAGRNSRPVLIEGTLREEIEHWGF